MLVASQNGAPKIGDNLSPVPVCKPGIEPGTSAVRGAAHCVRLPPSVDRQSVTLRHMAHTAPWGSDNYGVILLSPECQNAGPWLPNMIPFIARYVEVCLRVCMSLFRNSCYIHFLHTYFLPVQSLFTSCTCINVFVSWFSRIVICKIIY